MSSYSLDADCHVDVIVQPETIAVVEVGVQGPPGRDGTGRQARGVLIANPNQTNFVLPTTPVNPHLSSLFVNGERMTFAKDYAIDGSILRWISTELQLDPSDDIEIFYYETQTLVQGLLTPS